MNPKLKVNIGLMVKERLFDHANRLVAATMAERAQLEFLYQAEAAKICVIPPGVDLSRFYPIPKDEAKAVIGIPPKDRMILFVGRIEPLKGLETLLRALAISRRIGYGKIAALCIWWSLAVSRMPLRKR